MTKLNRLMASKNHPRPRERRQKNAPRVIEDQTVAFAAPPVRDRWDVVMLAPQANDGTFNRIRDAGYDVWRPRVVILQTSASMGKAMYVNRPLWPRYAFLGRNPGCPSTADVPYIGPVKFIGDLSGRAVTAVAAREESGEFDCRTLPPAPPFFAPGTLVKTIDDLLDGIVLRSEGERVLILMQIMGAEREVWAQAGKLAEKA